MKNETASNILSTLTDTHKNIVNSEDKTAYNVPEKTEKKCITTFSDVKLLAMVSGHKQSTCKNALMTHDSLHGIAKNTGLLDACLELSKRYIYEDLQHGDALCSPQQTKDFLKLQLDNEPAEVFAVLYLDNRNRVLKFDRLFYGTIDGASVYPREVVRGCIENNAAAVIFAHNHPSGVSEPSNADKQITSRLKDALSLIDVRVLDHMIVGDTVLSFAESGLI